MLNLMEEILLLSQSLLSHAKADQWTDFEQKFDARTRMLDKVLAQGQQVTDPIQRQLMAKMAREVQAVDALIAEQAREHQQKATESRQKLSRSNRAMNAYFNSM